MQNASSVYEAYANRRTDKAPTTDASVSTDCLRDASSGFSVRWEEFVRTALTICMPNASAVRVIRTAIKADGDVCEKKPTTSIRMMLPISGSVQTFPVVVMLPC